MEHEGGAGDEKELEPSERKKKKKISGHSLKIWVQVTLRLISLAPLMGLKKKKKVGMRLSFSQNFFQD